MIATQHTQTVSAFRKSTVATIDRVNQTGEAEVLTVNGEARAVILSPAAYDALAREAQLSRDTAMIRRAVQEIADGKGQDARGLFDALHAELAAR